MRFVNRVIGSLRNGKQEKKFYAEVRRFSFSFHLRDKMYVRRWLMHFSAVVQYTCYCHIDLFLAHNPHYKKNGMITRKIVLHNSDYHNFD